MLACSADVLQATLKRLRMFVLRAKCQLDDVSAEWRLWGLAGDSAAGVQPWSVEQFAAALRIGLPPAALQDGGSVPLALRLQSVAETDVPTPALDPSLWAGLEAASGVPRITAATSELFVPQMVNLEVVGGVNFQKGCYPGQEVVARSQYRGTTKRRAVLLAGTAAVAAGQEVFHSADPDQPAGAVVLAGAAPAGGSLLLASVKLDALEAGSLHAGVAGGALLTPLPLPYRLPAEAA
jgi:tRNA-modifying protein YgfZ